MKYWYFGNNWLDKNTLTTQKYLDTRENKWKNQTLMTVATFLYNFEYKLYSIHESEELHVWLIFSQCLVVPIIAFFYFSHDMRLSKTAYCRPEVQVNFDFRLWFRVRRIANWFFIITTWTNVLIRCEWSTQGAEIWYDFELCMVIFCMVRFGEALTIRLDELGLGYKILSGCLTDAGVHENSPFVPRSTMLMYFSIHHRCNGFAPKPAPGCYPLF